jgi:hypothetical protein
MARAGRWFSAAEAFVRASLAYHFAQFVYHEVQGLKDKAQTKKVSCHTRALPDLRPRGERVEIPFEGTMLPGILRLPTHATGAPGGSSVVILIAGLDSTKEEFYTLEQRFIFAGWRRSLLTGRRRANGRRWPCVLISRWRYRLWWISCAPMLG